MQDHIRWGAYGFLLGGVLVALGSILHPDVLTPGFALSPTWVPAHLLLAVGTIGVLFGFIGLALKLWDRLNAFERAALVVGEIMFALLSGLLVYFETWTLPVLARVNPALIEVTGPLRSGALGLSLFVTFVLCSLALIAIGILLIRQGEKYRISGILLLAGPIFFFSPPLPHWLGVVAGVASGAGLVMTGLALRETAPARRTRRSPSR